MEEGPTKVDSLVLYGATALSSLLSTVGCLFIIIRYIWARGLPSADVSKDLVFVLAIFDLLASLAFLLGQLPTEHFWNQFFSGPSPGTLCTVQGIFIQFFALASIFWNALMAYMLYRFVVRCEKHENIRLKVLLLGVAVICVCAVYTVIAVEQNLFGDATLWCWISQEHKEWQYILFYGWVILCWLFSCAAIYVVRRNIRRRIGRQQNLEALDTAQMVESRISLYVLTYILLWFPALVNRTTQYFYGYVFWTMLLQAMTAPLNGFVDAVIYSGVWETPMKFFARLKSTVVCCGRPGQQGPSNRKRTIQGGGAACNPSHLLPAHILEEQRTGQASMHLVTFNMNMGQIPRNLHSMLPLGYDLYVVAIQQATQPQEYAKRVLDHLNLGSQTASDSAKGPYTIVYREASNSFGGNCFTALMVFASQQAAEADVFFCPGEQHASRLGSLLSGAPRASVGICFRYFDAWFAVLTTSLTWDSRDGTSRKEQRIRDLHKLIKEAHMTPEEVGFDFSLLYHHTIILGDLNFILEPTYHDPDILQTLHEAVVAERQWRALEHLLSRVAQRGAAINPSVVSETRNSIINVDNISTAAKFAFETVQSPDLEKADTSLRDIYDEEDDAPLGQEAAEWQIWTPPIGGFSFPQLLEDSLRALTERENLWDRLVACDQLQYLKGKGDVLSGFMEMPIRFPPTYRYRVGHHRKLLEAKAKLDMRKTLNCRVGAIHRPPYYADRILFKSMAVRKEGLKLNSYSLVESVTTSDHKPVVCSLSFEVDRLYRPLEQTRELKRMEDMKNVYKFKVHLKDVALFLFKSTKNIYALRGPNASMKLDRRRSSLGSDVDSILVRENESTTVSSAVEGSLQADSELGLSDEAAYHTEQLASNLMSSVRSFLINGAATGPFPEGYSIDRVVAFFPIPCEDIFAVHRKLYEVVGVLDRGWTGGTGTKEVTKKTFRWEEVMRSGIHCEAHNTSQQKGMHMLLRFEDSSGNDLGQCVFAVVSPYGNAKLFGTDHSTVKADVSLCGQTIGTASFGITVECT